MNTFKRFYREAPVTAGLIFIIVIVYLYTTLRFGAGYDGHPGLGGWRLYASFYLFGA